MRHIPSAAFFLAVLAIASTYWIASRVISPGTSLDEAILFRPRGDSDYLPIVSALSRLEFGETSVRETAHQGVRSFPMAPLVMHGIMVRLAGDIGFVVADVLMFLLYGLALVYFLRSAEIPARLAEVLAVMVLGGVANQAVLTSARVFGDIPLTFWHSRFPRPGVTEVFVLAFFILAIRLIGRRGAATGARDWLLMGVVWACLLQADIYQAANLTLVAFLFAGYLLIVDTRRALRGIGAAACTAAICALPFVYQRLHEITDVQRRWGVFSSGHRFILFTPLRLILLACLVLAGGALLCRRNRGPAPSRRPLLLALLAVTVVVSLVSGPVSLLVLGKGIQIHHFVAEAKLNTGYAVLVCAGWILQDVLRWLYQNPRTAKPITPRVESLGVAVAMLTSLALAVLLSSQSFGEAWWGRDQSSAPDPAIHIDRVREAYYRSSFSGLHAALGRPEFRQAEVIGTFDGQLANWWEYRAKHLYLPDIFNTTVSDRELETRVFGFLHALCVTPADFSRLLDHWYFVLRVLAGAKYQANRIYTPWPLEEYAPSAQARIAGTSAVGINLEVPLPERRRLLEGYEHFDPSAEPHRQLDLIVLSQGDLRQYLHPENGKQILAWKNDVFEIWVPVRATEVHARGGTQCRDRSPGSGQLLAPERRPGPALPAGFRTPLTVALQRSDER